MNMFQATTEVRSLLLNHEELVKLVGEKVFPILAPDSTEGDYIVYQRDGFKEDVTKMGVYEQIPIVYVTAVSEDYDRSQKMAIYIYDALVGEFTNPDMAIQCEDATEDKVDNKFVQIIKISIRRR